MSKTIISGTKEQRKNSLLQLKIYQKISSVLGVDLIDFLEKNVEKTVNNIKITSKEDYAIITIKQRGKFYFTVLNGLVIPFYSKYNCFGPKGTFKKVISTLGLDLEKKEQIEIKITETLSNILFENEV